MPRMYWYDCWKGFFDWDKPWCSWFITKLVGVPYSGFETNFAELCANNHATHFLPQDDMKSGDSHLLSCIVDMPNNTLLMSTHSHWGQGLALELFYQCVSRVTMPHFTRHGEMYRLPDVYVFHCGPMFSELPDSMELTLSGQDSSVSREFRILDVFKAVPALHLLRTSPGAYMLLQQVQTLWKEFEAVGCYDTPQLREEFFRLCLLLSLPSAYHPSGASEEDLDLLISEGARKWFDGGFVSAADSRGKHSSIDAAVSKMKLW